MSEHPKYVQEFKRKGFCILKGVFSEREILEMRRLCDESESIGSYFSDAKKTVYGDELDVSLSDNPIMRLFIHKILEERLVGFSYGFDAKLLPPFEIMRNFIKPRAANGWHRDCAGEQQYEFCQTRLCSSTYFFSKVAVYLQTASIYGGTIKVIPYSHLVFRIPFSRFLQKVSTLVQVLMEKSYSLRKVVEALVSVDIEIDLGDVVVFDSRLLHAGKSLSSKVESTIDWVSENVPNLPIERTKYALYAHFGNAIGHDSYLYDRLRRDQRTNVKTKNELTWFANEFKVFEKDLSSVDPAKIS